MLSDLIPLTDHRLKVGGDRHEQINHGAGVLDGAYPLHSRLGYLLVCLLGERSETVLNSKISR